MSAVPIKLDPGEARRRIAEMIAECDSELKAMTPEEFPESYAATHWDREALKLALEAMKPVDRLGAIRDLLQEERANKGSNAACLRVLRAATLLGFTPEEQRGLFVSLGYCGPEGDPYSKDIKRVWP